MINALTVDLEDWYHICGVDELSTQNDWQRHSVNLESSVDKILALFKRHKVYATFFTVGILADKAPSLIKRIADAGHELASHGFAHRRIFDMDPEEFELDLVRSKEAIEKAAGRRICGYRAPEWSLKKNNIWALDILRKHEFTYDASAVPLSHLGGKYFGLYPYEIKTKYGNIVEFPLSTSRCFWERLPFSGGLPMRINPYFYIINCTISINKLGYPAIFYLHPWEFNNDHEKVDLPLNRQFMHYCNIRSTEKKFALLLERFHFSTVENVMKLHNSNEINYEVVLKQHKAFDIPYFKSIASSFVFVFMVSFFVLFLALLMHAYSLLLIVIIATVFYWPWGMLFAKIHTQPMRNPQASSSLKIIIDQPDRSDE